MQIVSALVSSLLLLGCGTFLFAMFRSSNAQIMRALRGEPAPTRLVAGNGHPIRRSARSLPAAQSAARPLRAAA